MPDSTWIVVQGPLIGQRVTALSASAGAWHGRTFTGSDYVDAVRGDLSERLNRLGLE